jgi:hypothetical protein
MATGSRDGYFKTLAGECSRRNMVGTRAVEYQESAGLIGSRAADIAHTAQIAFALLPDIGDE